ncbi:MAG TPA: dihydrofolate reductase family protein [Natronosporangium sp.]|nr:dihydrofolate reductase family protein [Natronosporangium sp.]
MADLILWEMLSLDGYYTAGPDDDLTWFRFDPQLEEYITSTQLDATALLFGRRTWEEMASYWPHATGRIAEFMNRVPKLVCSRTLTRADWPPTELVRDDVPGRVARLKQELAGQVFCFGSGELAATLIEHRLVDEYRIGVNPVLLGAGRRFFPGHPYQQSLRLTDHRTFDSGLVVLHYRPA